MYALIAFEIKNLLGYVHKTTAKFLIIHTRRVRMSKKKGTG
jgi:hypothetical protein